MFQSTMMAQARVAAARPSRHFARAFSSDVKMWSPDGDKLLNNDDMVAIITHNLERDQRKASEKVVPWYAHDQQDKTRQAIHPIYASSNPCLSPLYLTT
jgi:hypothetical protein